MINLLNDVIKDHTLKKDDLIDSLNRENPHTYLCGKSSSGKTSFLNALLNFEKNELFTSSDISTKVAFTFHYGDIEGYYDQGELISLPDSIEERKKLFFNINEKQSNCTLKLSKEILRTTSIVDIPGIFDFNNNNSFLNLMLNDADVILFFNPCLSNLTGQELETLKSISELGIPLIVLFTMGDITEPGEGITRKSLATYIEDKVKLQFNGLNISFYQIISADDFYKGKDPNGINNLNLHLIQKIDKYYLVSHKKKLKRCILNLIHSLNDMKAKIEKDEMGLNDISERENQIWKTTKEKEVEKQNIDDKKKLKKEFEYFEDHVKEQLFSTVYGLRINEDHHSKENKFVDSWTSFWADINVYFEDRIQIPEISIPEIKEGVFENIDINLEKITDFLNKKQEAKTQTTKEKTSNKKTGTKTNTDSNSWLKLDIKIEDLTKLAWEIGLNPKNVNIIYLKIMFYQECKKQILHGEKSIREAVQKRYEESKNLVQNQYLKKMDESKNENPFTSEIEKINLSIIKLNDAHFKLSE